MSASDAAPLPRLGEVFFDVRGESRSMRLSWYADTGVAVLSIWQGGMCTGTFRLPIDDLGRMIDILRRGPQPQGRRRPDASGRGPGVRGQAPAGHRVADPDATRFSFEAMPETGRHGSPGGSRRSRSSAGYGSGDADAGHAAGSYDTSGYDTGGYEPGGHDAGGYGSGGYEAGGYEAGGYESAGYGLAATGRHSGQDADYPGAESAGRDFPARSHWPHDGGYQPDVTGQQGFSESGAGEYGQDRFVPPYVRAPDLSYANDNPAGGPDRDGGYDGGAYPADRRAADQYPPRQPSGGGYFDRPDYLLTADPDVAARHSAGKYAGESHQAQFAGDDMPPAGNRVAEVDYRNRPLR